MERSEIKCRCRECGKEWRKGEQDDNETICLRCEHLARISREDYDADDDHSMDYWGVYDS